MTQYCVALSHEGYQHPKPKTFFLITSDLDLESLSRKTIAELFPDKPPTCSSCRTTLTQIDGIEAIKFYERRHRSPR